MPNFFEKWLGHGDDKEHGNGRFESYEDRGKLFWDVEIQNYFDKNGPAWQLNPHSRLINGLKKLDIGQEFPIMFRWQINDKKSELAARYKAAYMAKFFSGRDVCEMIERGDSPALLQRIPVVQEALRKIEEKY